MSRVIPFSEVRANGWIVVGDDVYDIAEWAAKHPGGDQILQLRGGDATFPLINAHGIRGALPRMPKKLIVGTIDHATLPAADRDLRGVWTGLRARGMFDYKRWWFAYDLVRGLGLFLAGWLLLSFSPIAALVFLTLARLNVMWWVHDVCHDSVFLDRKQAKRWAEAMSLLFVGTSILDYQYVTHRLHHGYTNTIGADQAIETGPVVWHELMRARTTDTFIPVQSFFWFLVVLPLTLPYFIYLGTRHALKEKKYWTLVAVAVRWAAVMWLFSNHLGVFFASSLISAYVLGLTASLNHFHRPMSSTGDWNFARSVTTVTQNLRATNRFAAWFLGGLSFHIEHHFFATMPRRNYRLIAPDIQAFCARHGLEYSVASVTGSIAGLWTKLEEPFETAPPPARPSMEVVHVTWRT